MNDPTSSRQVSGLRGAGSPVQNNDPGDDSTRKSQDSRFKNKDESLQQSVKVGGDKETEQGTSQHPARPEKHQAEPEKIEVSEIKEPDKVPEEVEGWVERVKRGDDVHLATPVTHQGETLVKSTKPKNVKVVLPLTDEETKKGLHHKVIDSVRWLAQWCVRLIKKIPSRVMYKKGI